MLKQALLSTDDSILVEESPYDDIFGIRLSADAAAETEQNQWTGCNLLGKALMEVRTELQGGTDAADIINLSRLDSVNKILRNGGTC